MRESIPCAKKDLGGFVDYLLPSKLSLPLVFITMQVRMDLLFVCIRYNLFLQKYLKNVKGREKNTERVLCPKKYVS